ncbi:MAG TPA: hypothetical protein VFN68_06455 [Acidimicrobiales bacterium]|nr:hypothetical protein [Acidimicrobiales bacterium]
MSAPDARLSAAERAALAGLEAAAAAADPHLAARLRGVPGTRWRLLLTSVQPAALRLWHLLLGLRWWGVPITLGGLALTVLGLGTGLAVSVLGAVIALAGLRVLAEMVEVRRRPAPERAEPGPGY